MSTRLDNTLASLNSATSKVRDAMKRALKSRAFGMFLMFTVIFVLTFVLCVIFSYIAKFCFAVFGEWLGLFVYLLISFGAVFAMEALARWVTVAQLRRAYVRR